MRKIPINLKHKLEVKRRPNFLQQYFITHPLREKLIKKVMLASSWFGIVRTSIVSLVMLQILLMINKVSNKSLPSFV